MSPRPEPLDLDPLYQFLDNNFSLEDLSAHGREVASGSATSSIGSDRSQRSVVPNTGGRTIFRARVNDVCLLAGILIMLLWPWIFLSIISARGGIPMGEHLAMVVKKHPQRTSFVITLFANIISIIISILFSAAILRFSQEWAMNNDHVTVFDISLISAFRNQSWPWEVQDHKYLLIRKRWLPVVLAGVCIAAFAVVPSGTTSLITPVSFKRTWPLKGTELNFSSNAVDCFSWFGNNLLPTTGTCSWNDSKGLRYENCPGINQLVNVLESGRSSIQSLFSNESESLILGELGANSSLRFLGPNRGVIPIGPNSIHGLDTLQPSPLSDAGTNPAILSYNYTLSHQGLTSNISCTYDTQSPIIYSAESGNDLGNVTGSCDEIGLLDFLGPLGYRLLNTTSTLASWPCTSIPNEENETAYYLYLRGYGAIYERDIGNISCSLSPIQPAVFPVTYQSSTGVFSTQELITPSTPPYRFFSDLIQEAMFSLVDVFALAQNTVNNLVAESVTDLGNQALRFPQPNDQYLQLYEAMIHGILGDWFTYARFLYSVNPNAPQPPESCLRTVNGTMSAEVTGWVARPVHIAFLMPMTILNLASLIVASKCILNMKSSGHESDPTDPRSLVLAGPRLDESEPSGWGDGVSYHSRESAMFQRSTEEGAE